MDAEPWYYNFLEYYTRLGMWTVITTVVITALRVFRFYVMGVVNVWRDGHEYGVAILILIGMVFLLCTVSVLLAVIFQAALILLAVDMGRSLRKLVAYARRKS